MQRWAVNKSYLTMYIYVTRWNNDEEKDIFEARLFLFINVILFERSTYDFNKPSGSLSSS